MTYRERLGEVEMVAGFIIYHDIGYIFQYDVFLFKHSNHVFKCQHSINKRTFSSLAFLGNTRSDKHYLGIGILFLIILACAIIGESTGARYGNALG